MFPLLLVQANRHRLNRKKWDERKEQEKEWLACFKFSARFACRTGLFSNQSDLRETEMGAFHMILVAIFALQVVLAAKEEKKTAFEEILQINNAAQRRFADAKLMPVLFEGDIVRTRSLDIDISNMKYAAEKGISKFDAITNGAWRGKVIPYTFARSFNSRGRQVVRQAIADYNRHTCIRWVPRSSQRSYVTFFHGGGCYSMIGQQGSPQRISLANPRCLTKGVAIHEMMHCAGFYHEQSRLDRDNHIRINWANIPSRVRYNFQKYRPGQASTLGQGYDIDSVMHYGKYAFSQNGRPTIVYKRNPSRSLGQRRGFSRIDIAQLNAYYKCSGTGKPKPTTPTTTTCKNAYIFCDALKGHCRHAWVLRNCRKSCNRCPTKPKPKPKPKPRCVDKHRSCPLWARKRFCTHRRYRPYMVGNCKKSCKICS